MERGRQAFQRGQGRQDLTASKKAKRSTRFHGKPGFFLGLDRVRFRKPVQAGDVLKMTAEILRRKGRIGKLKVEARVDNRLVFEGIMQFALEAQS